MKKIIGEFKKFITRGNVIDLAVGVIMGSSFTAIVNGIVKGIFMPLIGTITGGSFETWVTVLWTAERLDPAKAVAAGIEPFVDGHYYEGGVPAHINWGTLVSAIINFLAVAVVLFIIVKVINTVRANSEKGIKQLKEKTLKAQLKSYEKTNAKRIKKGLKPLPIPAYLLPPPPEPEPEPVEPPVDPQIELLTEIRDLLKNKESKETSENE